MNSMVQAGLVLGASLVVGLGLFCVDSHESCRKNFDMVKIGMSRAEAAQLLRDRDAPFCAASIGWSERDCWFRDEFRIYRVDFDPRTGNVTGKVSYQREPRSVLDRIIPGSTRERY